MAYAVPAGIVRKLHEKANETLHRHYGGDWTRMFSALDRHPRACTRARGEAVPPYMADVRRVTAGTTITSLISPGSCRHDSNDSPMLGAGYSASVATALPALGVQACRLVLGLAEAEFADATIGQVRSAHHRTESGARVGMGVRCTHTDKCAHMYTIVCVCVFALMRAWVVWALARGRGACVVGVCFGPGRGWGEGTALR